MGHVVAGVDGEVIGFVGVVFGVRVEGGDPDSAFGSDIGDLDGFAGLGIGTAVDGGGSARVASSLKGWIQGPGWALPLAPMK